MRSITQPGVSFPKLALFFAIPVTKRASTLGVDDRRGRKPAPAGQSRGTYSIWICD